MATDATDESAVGSEGRSVVCWTTSMSTFMLKHLCAIVEGGARTSTGFKIMHYNGCARALNEHFRQSLTGAQISNHHRTIKKKFAMIQKIKDTVSGAQWDDETSTIRLEHEMAINYIAVRHSFIILLAGIVILLAEIVILLAGIVVYLLKLLAGIAVYLLYTCCILAEIAVYLLELMYGCWNCYIYLLELSYSC
jgi:hypothetical protein